MTYPRKNWADSACFLFSLTILLIALAVIFMLTSTAKADVLVSDQQAEVYRSMLPASDIDRWNELFTEGELLFYSERVMPRAYQHVSPQSARATFHWPGYNISGDYLEMIKGHGRGGNANIEFPWKTPGGLAEIGQTANFKFLHLPRDAQGRRLPVVYFQDMLPRNVHDNGVGLKWIFPRGAVLGECLLLPGPRGEKYTFEVRLRIRERDYWDVDILRPYPTAKDLYQQVAQLRPTDTQVQQVAAQLLEAAPIQVRTLRGKHPTMVSFQATAGEDVLPPLDPELVSQLLTSVPFKSSVGAAWREGPGGAKAFAPTTDAAFHIVPRGYQGTFLGTDTDSCMKCHESTQQHATHFDRPRQWYGFVRGSDGIFSFHPVEPSSIADNGGQRPVVIRRALLESGYVAPYNRAVHTPERYQAIRELID